MEHWLSVDETLLDASTLLSGGRAFSSQSRPWEQGEECMSVGLHNKKH